MPQIAIPKKLTASGIAYTGECQLMGMQIGTDSVTDPQITVYDNVAASGVEVVPTAVYDATALGLSGFTAAYGKQCFNGLYVLIEKSGGGAFDGSVEVVLDIVPA